ncbi:MarR family winged helix-turn-helix transcriptional regulator [Plantactinospora siamensis]|uniref:MarR family winged helix-turn-helix transcriptional regulator n=1 Tax=Plantactinospora siamensis TaxID=555372 RepID=A0ABV6P234_9ACTN
MDQTYAGALNQAIRLLSLRHRTRAAQLLGPLGLHPGQEALLLEIDRTGPRNQAQLSEALGCEPPSVTLMTRKLEAAGHIERTPDPTDKRASIVALTASGQALADRITELWVTLAEETVRGLPADLLERLPGVLQTMSTNVSGKSAD